MHITRQKTERDSSEGVDTRYCSSTVPSLGLCLIARQCVYFCGLILCQFLDGWSSLDHTIQFFPFVSLV